MLNFSLKLGQSLSFLLVATALTWALDGFRLVGFNLYNEQFLAMILGFALSSIFLLRNALGVRRQRGSLIDILLAALALGACGYVAVFYPQLLDNLYSAPLDATACGTLILAALLETLRRTAGLVLAGVALGFCIIGLSAQWLPEAISGRALSFDTYISYLTVDAGGFLGFPLMIASTVVAAFIFFGHMLNQTGGSRFFTDIALAWMGGYRGGAAKVSVLASSLFGSISGSAVANVTSTGIITIPLMKRAGFSAHRAAAIEAVASTGGQLMPPVMGAAAFLMAELLQIPYADIALAALIPALLYYGALFVQIDLIAVRDKIPTLPRSERPEAGAVMAKGAQFILPFVVLIGALFLFNQPAEKAALIAVGALLLIALLRPYEGQTLSFARILAAFRSTGHAVADIIVIGVCAGLVIGTLNITAIGFSLTISLVEFGADNLPLLLLIAAVTSIVLGMGMPTLGVYLLLATMIAPAMVELGIPQLSAHMFVLYFGMLSMLTPPIAIAAFAAASLAEAPPVRTSLIAVSLGWTAYLVPFLFVYSPEILMIGPWQDIALSVARITLGTLAVTLAIAGFWRAPLSRLARGLLLIAGALLFVPGVATPFWALINTAGAVTAMLVLLMNYFHARPGKLPLNSAS
ncbi:TRAP transporter permease [Marinobacterium rhizophilum]|uniref:TRAP transporter fused permease subunit n=1 Tax=Marinobacterium rhizophilum TaxID=420402 RepID=A0ABY5HCT8_9GAMM|nr:TRAP transporter fused permease subunit [Marinobacterium rhizophilum]UTW10152.1 TRAP transporter fused permease subunit [Marinobacterium rhizophilum]